MKVKFKKLHEDAVIPSYAKPGDAGMDLTAVSVCYESDIDCIVYDTGLALEIPEGYVGLIFPRSSLSKKDLILTNHVGVIDSGYRGSIKLKFKPDMEHWCEAEDLRDLKNGTFDFYKTAEGEWFKQIAMADVYAVGDRIGQLIILPYPNIELEEGELSTSERNDGGFGSTNK